MTAAGPDIGRRWVVVGGAGAVGRMFVDRLLAAGAEVCVVDPTVPTGPAHPRRRVRRGDVTRIDSGLAAELGRADAALLAVPEPVALAAVGPVADALRPGALLVDTLSVKERVVAAGAALTGVEVLSLNPMFAPSVPVAGQAVAAVVVRDGPRGAALLRLIEDWGARVVVLGAREHDRLAAATQALTHAAVLAAGLALVELEVDLAEAAAVAPPPHATLLALLARICAGAPEVYWDVQAGNPQAAAVRRALAAAVRRVAELVETGDVAGFARALDRISGFFGPELGRHRDRCARLFAGLAPATPMTPLDRDGGRHDPDRAPATAPEKLGRIPDQQHI